MGSGKQPDKLATSLRNEKDLWIAETIGLQRLDIIQEQVSRYVTQRVLGDDTARELLAKPRLPNTYQYETLWSGWFQIATFKNSSVRNTNNEPVSLVCSGKFLVLGNAGFVVMQMGLNLSSVYLLGRYRSLRESIVKREDTNRGVSNVTLLFALPDSRISLEDSRESPVSFRVTDQVGSIAFK